MGGRRLSSSTDSVHRQPFRFGSLSIRARACNNLSAFESCNTTSPKIASRSRGYASPVRVQPTPVAARFSWLPEVRARSGRHFLVNCTCQLAPTHGKPPPFGPSLPPSRLYQTPGAAARKGDLHGAGGRAQSSGKLATSDRLVARFREESNRDRGPRTDGNLGCPDDHRYRAAGVNFNIGKLERVGVDRSAVDAGHLYRGLACRG